MSIFKRANAINSKRVEIINNDFIIGKDETLNPKFTRIFGITYAVNVYYLKIQKPELFLDDNCINIHLPMNLRNQNNQNLLNAILLKMYTKIAENEIELIMEKARHTFGFAPEDYEIKKMEGYLAKTDKDIQSILINPNIVMYSKDIVEYIVFHQFCHLKYKTHSQKFYEMLSSFKPNYETLARQISNLKY